MFQIINQVSPPRERAVFKAVARRAIWESPTRREILGRCWQSGGTALTTADVVALLKLMETYEPIDRADLLGRIPHWQQVVRQELSDASAKPFFNERVADLHGGGRDQRRQNPDLIAEKQAELEFLQRLQRSLAD